MKRFFPVLLALVVCFTCLVAPVSATDIYDDLGMVDALAYQDQNSFYYYPRSTTYTVTLNKPTTSFVEYAEMIVSTDYQNLSVHFWYQNQFPLTVISLGNNLYKCIWKQRTAQADWKMYFSGSNAANYLSIVSLKYSSTPLDWKEVTGQCSISNSNYTDLINFNPADSTNERSWTDNGSYNFTDTILELSTTGFNNSAYDFVSFTVQCRVNAISSIACYVGNGETPIPFSSSIVENDSLVANMYTINIVMDLRNISKLSGTPYCRINCQVISGGLNHVAVKSISGYTVFSDVNPIIYWLKNIKANLSVWFGDLISSVDSLVNGSVQDQTNASDFNTSVNEQASQFEDMTNSMESVNRPDPEDVDIDFSQYVSQSDITGITSPLQALFSGDIFGAMLILAVIMGTVSFVFYGKR